VSIEIDREATLRSPYYYHGGFTLFPISQLNQL